MNPKRLFTIAAFALIVAAAPIKSGEKNPLAIRLSTASCADSGCGIFSKMDCICPDMQEKNRKPRCIDPGA